MSIKKDAKNTAVAAENNPTLLEKIKAIVIKQIPILWELAEHIENDINANDEMRERITDEGGKRAWGIYTSLHPEVADLRDDLDTEYHRLESLINSLEQILVLTDTKWLSLSQYKYLSENVKLLGDSSTKSELEAMLALEWERSPELRMEFETNALEEIELSKQRAEQVKLDNEKTKTEAILLLQKIITDEEPLINNWTFFGFSSADRVSAAKELLKHLDKDNKLSMDDLISFADKNAAIYKVTELGKIFEFICYNIYEHPRSPLNTDTNDSNGPSDESSMPTGLG